MKTIEETNIHLNKSKFTKLIKFVSKSYFMVFHFKSKFRYFIGISDVIKGFSDVFHRYLRCI